MSDYTTEFPDFDEELFVTEQLAGFVDVSWHNDAMPRFENEDLDLGLWVDYARPGLRDDPNGRRFILTSVDYETEHLATDSWADVVGFVERIRRNGCVGPVLRDCGLSWPWRGERLTVVHSGGAITVKKDGAAILRGSWESGSMMFTVGDFVDERYRERGIVGDLAGLLTALTEYDVAQQVEDELRRTGRA